MTHLIATARQSRWRNARLGACAGIGLVLATAISSQATPWLDPLTGQRSALNKDWIGLRPLPADTPLLVMAGHADSQGVAGPGTSGAAVALAGAQPMIPGITDELYWNLVVAREVVAEGQRRGLNIRYYEPPFRSIPDGNDPRTNWSVGRAFTAQGGYALEIHFDAYGPDGIGSGLIPALHRPFSRVDESLASAFGAYPMAFRGGLGGPRRGLSLLEIGKLESPLEDALRDPSRRAETVRAIAGRVVTALEVGLNRRAGPTAMGVSRSPGAAGSGRPVLGPTASSGVE
jgi:hypothetical protein